MNQYTDAQLKEQEATSPRVHKDEWNRSSVDDLIKRILGPLARTWKDKSTGRISVGLEKGSKKMVLGSGENYRRAFENVFVDPKKRIEELYEQTPSWRDDLKQLKEQVNVGKTT